MKARLLELFSCASGAGYGYGLAGYEVVSVDIEPQPNCPHEFIQADALEILRDKAFVADFDAIHTSPPCQRFTAYRRRGAGVGESYPDLIAPVRTLLKATGLPYVIENVVGAPLIEPVMLCGSSFGLNVRRHRVFETSGFEIGLVPPCNHGWQKPRFPGATNRTNLRCTVEVGVYRIPLTVQREAMGIDWMTLSELSQAIPPAYTEFIGHALMTAIEAAAA